MATTIKEEYLLWIAEKIDADWVNDYSLETEAFSQRDLFMLLDEVIFTWRFPMDQNRAEDGIELRYRFGYETGQSPAKIASELDIRPCSMLEMMTALALRCWEEFLYGMELRNGAADIFHEMLRSLGLENIRNRIVDEGEARAILNNFCLGRYERNGAGGLFTVNDKSRRMPQLEICEQMNIWLSEQMRMREARQ